MIRKKSSLLMSPPLLLSSSSSGLRMAVDDQGDWAVNMRACSGPQFRFPNTCFYRPFDPFARTRADASGGFRLLVESESGGLKAPLAMHVPGGPRTQLHHMIRRNDSVLGRGLPRKVLLDGAPRAPDAGAAAAEHALGRRLSAAAFELLRTLPVALLASDPPHGRACGLTTLGEMAPRLLQPGAMTWR